MFGHRGAAAGKSFAEGQSTAKPGQRRMTAVSECPRAWYAGLLASRKYAGQSQSDGSRDVCGSSERGRRGNGLKFRVVMVPTTNRANSER